MHSPSQRTYQALIGQMCCWKSETTNQKTITTNCCFVIGYNIHNSQSEPDTFFESESACTLHSGMQKSFLSYWHCFFQSIMIYWLPRCQDEGLHNALVVFLHNPWNCSFDAKSSEGQDSCCIDAQLKLWVSCDFLLFRSPLFCKIHSETFL